MDGIIIKHHKSSINTAKAKRIDNSLVDVYYYWNKMYLYSRREYFVESELEIFDV